MFHDLCVSLKSAKDQDRESVVRRLIELGYSSVAWNTTVAAKALQNAKPLKSFNITKRLVEEMAPSRGLAGVPPLSSPEAFKQYSRVTVVAADITEAQALTTGNPGLMSYDIVAASPRSLSAFLHLCKQAEVDIISLDFSHKLNFHIDQKHVAAALKRGILFEITYSPVVQASATRRQVLDGTNLLIEYVRGKQFVLTSDAENIAQIRGPHDVMNIGCILGLPEEQARKSISDNCGLVLLHAHSRKLRYTSVEIMNRPEFKSKWSNFDHLLGFSQPAPPATINTAADDMSGSSDDNVGGSDDGEGGGSEDENDSLGPGLAELTGSFIPGNIPSSEASENSDSDEEPAPTNLPTISSSVSKRALEEANSGSSDVESDAGEEIIIPVRKQAKVSSSGGLDEDFLSFGSKPANGSGALKVLEESKSKFKSTGFTPKMDKKKNGFGGLAGNLSSFSNEDHRQRDRPQASMMPQKKKKKLL